MLHNNLTKLFTLIISVCFLATGCSGSGGGYSEYEYPDQYSDEQIEFEPDNPYSTSQEGHYAGYEWAVDNDVDFCGGNSSSFIEGCEEYLSQKEAFDDEDQSEESGEDYYYNSYR